MSGALQLRTGMGKTPAGATVSISPGFLYGTPANGISYSATATATPSGITSPTYLWSWLSGGTGFTLTNTTTATVGVSSTGHAGGTDFVGELKCVVSGTGGPATSSINVEVQWGM